MSEEPTAADLRQWRRDLHQIPETDFDLPETLAYIEHELEGVRDALVARGQKAEILHPCRSTVCLFLDRGSEHTTALRSDMDALPVTETTGVPFASTHPHKMHACGHDGHMAMLLGLAHHLVACADELPRSVLLVFQPAEETTGGARIVCESGIFRKVHADRIFGFHLWPDLPKGTLASKPGPLLAGSHETDVTFLGKASHIAKADQGADALSAVCRFQRAAADLLEERRAVEPCILKFGRMEAGSVRNQIADTAKLEGSLRIFSDAMDTRLQDEVKDLAARAAEAERCTSEVHFSQGYPPVTNDPGLFQKALAALPELELLPEPLLIAEDFAWYQRYLPGVFLLLSTGEKTPLHAADFNFDESILTVGLSAYERLIRMP
jgi:hippurate hydrolase